MGYFMTLVKNGDSFILISDPSTLNNLRRTMHLHHKKPFRQLQIRSRKGSPHKRLQNFESGIERGISSFSEEGSGCNDVSCPFVDDLSHSLTVAN
jgi:hypothetical protein